MPLNFPVTLVIPILNEADSLPELLNALKEQDHLPDEIIFRMLDRLTEALT